MLEVVLEQPGRFNARNAVPPRPAAGEALVRIRRVGICGTDFHAFAGRQPFFSYPRILGHELAGEIVEIAPPAAAFEATAAIAVGQQAAIEPYLRCGHCRACRVGRYNCCESLACLGVHTDGGMRELVCVPLEMLHTSAALSLDQLALVETLGIGAHAVARSGLQSGETALVVGAGPIGLATVQFALLAGAAVYVLEPDAARREFAGRFGATTLAAPPETPFDVVFDATGNAAVMGGSLQHVAHGGRLVFVGLVQGPVAIDDPTFHRREVTLFASRNSCHDFPRIIELIEQGRLDTRPWITHRLSLAQVPAEFAALRTSAGLIKAMIDVAE